MTTTRGIATVEATLRRRFRVVETDVVVAGRTLSILHPESAEDLIDEQEFERDERLPYWAELWPSARVLAEHVANLPGRGRSLLELGCGSGLVSTSAGLAGFTVVVSDYYEDAMRFAQVNAARNGAPIPESLLLDWRHLPPTLAKYDLVLASDVLYEREYGELVAQVLAATLSDDGVAIVADPGRVGRDDFTRSLKALGLRLVRQTDRRYEEGRVRQKIALFEIARSPVR